MERPALILQLEYLADILMKAEPLATGLATDVHGQVALCDFYLNVPLWYLCVYYSSASLKFGKGTAKIYE
jgi:hypothetical protein